jgi:hypothetical protein
MVKRMPPLFGAGSVFPSRAELSDGKQREEEATEVEGRELLVVDDLWPAEVAVEVPKRREVSRAPIVIKLATAGGALMAAVSAEPRRSARRSGRAEGGGAPSGDLSWQEGGGVPRGGQLGNQLVTTPQVV